MSIGETIWSRFALEKQSTRLKKWAWRTCRQFLAAQELELEFGIPTAWNWRIVEQTGTLDDQAIRLLLESKQAQRCETVVLFPRGRSGNQASFRPPRSTACVSSQPGCGVGCPFCATGELGYQGDFTTEQIVEQVYLAGVVARQVNRRVRNVVFMGMGEPLHNPDSVLAAIDMLTSETYFGLAPRRITVSTAGVPAQMIRLARTFPQVRIALSLHAAEPDLRRQLVPRATSDLELLEETIRKVNDLQPSTPLWLEIVLLAGINDGAAQAKSIVAFCKNLHVEVNLIPYNSAAGTDRFASASKTSRERFASILRDAGIRTTIRTSFGADRNAACGQLNALRRESSPASTYS